MSKPTSYAPGRFAWVDLRTTDPARAKRFYAGLFGWTYTDLADPPGGRPYGIAALEGDPVAGLRPLSEAQRTRGVAPFWYSYVAVKSAQAAAERTRELGGAVHAGPVDNGGGPLAIIGDPIGAKLVLWASRNGAGACRVDEPGCMTWHELNTTDAPAAIGFYWALFGWRIEPTDAGEHWTIVDGARRAGVRKPVSEQAASWTPYFEVASLDETLGRAADAGGVTLAAPLRVGGGQGAIIRDPQGAVFGIAQGP